MVKNGFAFSDESTLDILLIISCSGLLLQTTDFADKLFKSSYSDVLHIMEYLWSLCKPIIENYFNDQPMIHRRIPNVSAGRNLNENILKNFIASYIKNSEEFVEYESSIFQKVWTEEEFFRFLKSVPLPPFHTSATQSAFEFQNYKSFIYSFKEDERIPVSFVSCFEALQ